MPSITLEFNECEMFTEDLDIARQFGTVKNMLEDLGMDKEGEDAIPLSNVNGANLSKVIEWKTFHKDDPSLPEDEDNKKKTDTISSWDLDFLKVDQETLFKVIPAANYLNIKKLLDVTCKTLANMIKGENSQEIRNIFNIRNGLTSKEEEQIKKENEWVMVSMEHQHRSSTLDGFSL